MRWLIGILINAILFVAIAGFSEESFYVSSFGAAIGASFILSILNILVRPILIILTLPVTLVTLMGSSFEIASFGTALLVAVIMAIANIIIQKVVFEPAKDNKE